MNIKLVILTFLMLSISINAFSQKAIQGRVLDKTTEQPIEFVSIYDDTNSNFVITNAEGKFTFSTKSDSIYFSIIGYEKLVLLSESIQNNTTIYLESQAYQLNEVVVGSDTTDMYTKARRVAKNNYPNESFREEFYLRSVLRKNDTIVKIQDLNGVIERSSLLGTPENPILKPNKDYSVYINNMRKAGYDEKGLDFEFFDFEEILTELVSNFVSPKLFDIEETILTDSTLVKLEFTPKSSEKITATAYYIINTEDNAFIQTYFLDHPKLNFTEKRGIKYRNVRYEVLVSFAKDLKLNKYRIDNSKITGSVELINKDEKRSIYDVTYILKTKPYDDISPLKGKVSLKKNIFNLKKEYNAAYWENNNILQLTDEMVLFLESLKDLDSKEFKVTSNIK